SQQNKVSRKEVSTPKSEVLTHLQSLKGNGNHDPAIYRQEIENFKKGNSIDKIAASQRQVLEPASSSAIHQKDNSKTLRRQVRPRSEEDPNQEQTPSFPRGTRLGIDALSHNQTQGFIQGFDTTGGEKQENRVSLFHSQKVNYYKKQYNRDYVVVAEGDELNQIVRLQLGVAKPMSWGGPAHMVFWQETVKTDAEGKPILSRGVLQYGGGEEKAEIEVPSGVDMIKKGTTYAVNIPDNPHNDASAYGKYSDVWFRIKDGPQGDEYVHRGDYSAGCISVTGNWRKVFRHIINKRHGSGHIGSVARVDDSNRG
ncbi:MAG: hypothetical protein WBG70_06700, partial [Spirulinaceae cyanobacterium]